MEIYFVRHGESTANQQRVFSNRAARHPLTAAGRQQAAALAQTLAGQTFTAIYASPVRRARQTARILAAALGAPLYISEALREWDVGIYEGTRDPRGWELHRQVQEAWFERQDFDCRMPGGESYTDLQRRFRPFITERTAGGRPAERLLLVGHGGLYLAMLPGLLVNINFAFARQHGFPYTGYVLAETRGPALVCRTWCGVTPPPGS